MLHISATAADQGSNRVRDLGGFMTCPPRSLVDRERRVGMLDCTWKLGAETLDKEGAWHAHVLVTGADAALSRMCRALLLILLRTIAPRPGLVNLKSYHTVAGTVAA